MTLGHLVMLVAAIQASLDTTGLLLRLQWVGQGEDTSLPREVDYMVGPLLIKDFSNLHESYTLHYSEYVVPHLFSGVLARMLRGFPCVTAEQMVEELLMDWQEELGLAEELEVGGGGYVMPAGSEAQEELQLEGEALEEGEVVEEIEDIEEEELVEEIEDIEEEELVEEIEVDEVVVSQWRKRVRQFSIIHSNVTLEAEERLVSALAQRSSSCGPGPPSCALEVAFLAANLGATALLVMVSNLRQYPRLHLPWMLLASLEIIGNSIVAVAFLLIPGPALIISLVCMAKVVWLRWIWASLVRHQMREQINTEADLKTSMTDLESRLLKAMHGERVGKVRLARVLG